MIQRFSQGPRMSQAVVAGGFIFLAGQVAADPNPSVANQSRQILDQIDGLLTQCGATRGDLVNVSVWLADIQSFQDFNDVWDRWIPADNTPARATVEAKLAFPEYLVEIAAIAYKQDH